MQKEIFGKICERYYRAGLPVIPLYPPVQGSEARWKSPFMFDWSKYCTEMPSTEEQTRWKTSYPRNNIGLPLGPQSGLWVVDIDTEDTKIIKLIESVLPPTPWVRVGRPNTSARVYRIQGEVANRQIQNADGGVLVEFLCKGKQMVLPPSIHPKTQGPYWVHDDADLITELEQGNIPELGIEIIDIIRDKLEAEGVPLSSTNGRGSAPIVEYATQGGRDIAQNRFAGLMAYAVTKGDKTVKEAFEMMTSWGEDLCDKVDGDLIDFNKGFTQIVQYIRSAVEDKGAILPKEWDAGIDAEDLASYGLDFSKDKIVCDTETAMIEISTIFHQKDISDFTKLKEVKKVLTRVSRNAILDPLEEAMLLGEINKMPGFDHGVATYKKFMKEAKKGQIQGECHHELAEATLSDFTAAGEFTYKAGQFIRWNGVFWEEVVESEILAHISRVYGHYPAAKKHNDHQGILRNMRALAIEASDFEVGEGINFLNGYLNPKHELLAHKPEQGMSYVLPYNYDPKKANECPKWMNLIETSFRGEKAKIDALQEAMYATLMGNGSKNEKCILLYGMSKAGKSQIMDVVSTLVPPSIQCSISPDGWNKPVNLVQLYNKRLNVCGELSETHKIAGDKFKSVVTGESISAKYMYKEMFSFRPTCMHWFASNHLPKSNDHTAGFRNRWLILHFDNPVPVKDRIFNLAEKIIAEEQEAIVAWVCQGRDRHPYTFPESHTEFINLLREQGSNVERWMDDYCCRDDAASTLMVEAYKHYESVCYMNMLKPYPEGKFKEQMMGAGFRLHKKSYLGMKLNKLKL